MRHTIVAFLSALLFLAFTPTNARADDHRWDRRHHRYYHDRVYVYHHYDHHYYGDRRRRSEYREAHWAWVNHHRIWVPARTVVIYF